MDNHSQRELLQDQDVYIPDQHNSYLTEDIKQIEQQASDGIDQKQLCQQNNNSQNNPQPQYDAFSKDFHAPSVQVQEVPIYNQEMHRSFTLKNIKEEGNLLKGFKSESH